jgi:hypothetical protein
MLRNTPEERRSHQHRGGSLKLRLILKVAFLAHFYHFVLQILQLNDK